MVTLTSLPLEIRSLIYTASLTPRIITITPSTCTPHTITLQGALTPPAIFQVSRQMRTDAQIGFAALEIMQSCCYGYQRLYDACVEPESKRVLPKLHIYAYVSYAHDTLYLRDAAPGAGCTAVLSSLGLDPARLRSLAVVYWEDVTTSWYAGLRLLCRGLRLSSLTFVFVNRGRLGPHVPGGAYSSLVSQGRLLMSQGRPDLDPVNGIAFEAEEGELISLRPGMVFKPLSVLIAENLCGKRYESSAVDNVAVAKEDVARVCNVVGRHSFASEAVDENLDTMKVTISRKLSPSGSGLNDFHNGRRLCKICQIPLE